MQMSSILDTICFDSFRQDDEESDNVSVFQFEEVEKEDHHDDILSPPKPFPFFQETKEEQNVELPLGWGHHPA